ncbi:MAG TPA: acetylglutamate kinase [Candidatus Limnocylindrales bacterium]|nr:acetylglutamate kinase [Candidatus Limnocylindrales bacterium]
MPADLADVDFRAWEELVVVKIGGTTLAADDGSPGALGDIVAAQRGRSLVLVHGGGNRLTEWLERLGIESRFIDGRRVTDDQALEAAVAVFAGLVNTELVAQLNAAGVAGVGLTGIDGRLLVARRSPQLGRVGRVEAASPSLVYALLAGGALPVVAPLALDERGEICNVNADEVAAALAGALGARLVLLTDTDGVLDGAGRTLGRLGELEAQQLMAEGVIAGGMVPKVEGALAALRSGATQVVIADGRVPGALGRALEDDSFGTRLRAAAHDEMDL